MAAQLIARIDTDTCAADEDHDLPEMVEQYHEDESFWVARRNLRVTCGPECSDTLTEYLTGGE